VVILEAPEPKVDPRFEDVVGASTAEGKPAIDRSGTKSEGVLSIRKSPSNGTLFRAALFPDPVPKRGVTFSEPRTSRGPKRISSKPSSRASSKDFQTSASSEAEGYDNIMRVSTQGDSSAKFAARLTRTALLSRTMSTATMSTQHWSLRLIRSPWFTSFITIAILLNAIQLGIAVEMHDEEDTQVLWIICENFFTVIWSLEFALKIFALGKLYFHDSWNIFDGIFAVMSMMAVWLAALPEAASKVSVVRVFRLFRLVRLVRVLALRRELLMILSGFVTSVRSMVWVALVLSAILYMCALICVEVVGRNEFYYDWDNEQYFGGIIPAMLSLCGLVMLAEWFHVREVWNVQPWFVPFFLGFVIFVTFGLLNVVIGIIMESVHSADSESKQQEQEKKQKEQMEKVFLLSSLFDDIRASLPVSEWAQRSEAVSEEVMETAVSANSGLLRDALQGIDLPHGFLTSDLHDILDEDCDGTLTRKEFVEGMFRLIYSNDMQRYCLLAQSVSRIRKEVLESRSWIMTEMRTELREATRQMIAKVDRVEKLILGQQQPVPSAGGASDERRVQGAFSIGSNLKGVTLSDDGVTMRPGKSLKSEASAPGEALTTQTSLADLLPPVIGSNNNHVKGLYSSLSQDPLVDVVPSEQEPLAERMPYDQDAASVFFTRAPSNGLNTRLGSKESCRSSLGGRGVAGGFEASPPARKLDSDGFFSVPSQGSIMSTKQRLLAAEAYSARAREVRRSRHGPGAGPGGASERRTPSADNSSVGSGGNHHSAGSSLPSIRRLSSGLKMGGLSSKRSARLGGIVASDSEARVRACLPDRALGARTSATAAAASAGERRSSEPPPSRMSKASL